MESKKDTGMAKNPHRIRFEQMCDRLYRLLAMCFDPPGSSESVCRRKPKSIPLQKPKHSVTVQGALARAETSTTEVEEVEVPKSEDTPPESGQRVIDGFILL